MTIRDGRGFTATLIRLDGQPRLRVTDQHGYHRATVGQHDGPALVAAGFDVTTMSAA